MIGLTHKQARRLLNMAVDRYLDPQERESLQVHVNHCQRCRAYAEELEWLNGAVGRALRLKWSAPRRSPIDTAGRVRQRLRADLKKKIALGIARTMVKIGSLAMVAMLIGALLRAPTVTRRSPVLMNNNNFVGLPRFELAADDATPSKVQVSAPDDASVLPATPTSHLHASQY